jgi:hypothetical protein
MNRPLAVTVISWIYIVMGIVGLIYHAREFRPPFSKSEFVFTELLRCLAIIAGLFMLRAKNPARWLAVIWVGLHVGISFYHEWQQVMMHAIFFVIITYLLTRPEANAYFRSRETA